MLSATRMLRGFGGFALWLIACLFAPLIVVLALADGVRGMARSNGIGGVLVLLTAIVFVLPVLWLLATRTGGVPP